MSQIDNLSVDAQKRVDTMKARADAYFDFEWLFQLLWEEFKNSIAKKRLNEFCDNLQKERERRFVWAFVESHRSSLEEIREMQKGLFEDEDFGLVLYEERLRLIDEFFQSPLSLRWSHIYQSVKKNQPNNSWRIFARNLKFDDAKEAAGIKRFLYLLDKICLITDLLTNRATDIDLTVSLVKYRRKRLGFKSQKTNEPPRDILIQAIKQCEDMFTRQTAWAVVYVLCREDYDIPENKSNFERYAQDLLKDSLLEDFKNGCPNGTIQSAEQGNNGSGSFFRSHSKDWVILGGYPWAIDLMAKLRSTINALELEKKAEEQKELYKLSEKGF